MIKIILCFLCSSLAKILAPCENIHQNVLTPLKEIENDMNRIGFPLKINHSRNTGYICQKTTTDFYGVCLTNLITNRTDIYISHRLLFSPNTLFNVLYHEIFHAFSIEHSELPGLMNYSVKLNKANLVVEDLNKLYPSFYDIRNMLNSYKSKKRKMKIYRSLLK
jgi:hypothetical protein